jgi:hypothetical protein
MNVEIMSMPVPTQTLYETDFNLWIEQTVNQLKTGDLTKLDLENLIEEIDSMGRNNKREIYSRLTVLIMHLLKWKYQSEKRSSSWISTINEQRRQIKLVLKDSPSLKPYLRDNLQDCYQDARLDAATETELSLDIFPLDCPFSQEEILTTGFMPD